MVDENTLALRTPAKSIGDKAIFGDRFEITANAPIERWVSNKAERQRPRTIGQRSTLKRKRCSRRTPSTCQG